ncbi:P45 [Betabaculovirus altermyunipunctae]|uniref:P45 n=1 Tax=Betabaculovirus altermyunipunctae TaxID=3051996 RepID=A0A1S5YE00_9BBAC|nr:P45 [Betabaculovirus altermyunipunctae]AQQ80352.1 P45 [Betabaculovirus altermyunipunctae]
MQHEIDYTLRFFKFDTEVAVKFVAVLTEAEIDTLVFLLAEYYGQQSMLRLKGLTFFSQYRYVIDVIKKDYENRTDNDDEVKKIFKLFVDNEFIGQVPSFQMIMQIMRSYYKPLPFVQIELCADCQSVNRIDCTVCKATYVSRGISLLDSTIQEGWDIYFRPMLGIPLLFFMLFRSDMTGVDQDVFSVDNIITNTLLMFFYNLLCDKATPMYWDHKKCQPLVAQCRKYVRGMHDDALQYLLTNLNSTTYQTKVYAPVKQFMERHFKNNKHVSKLVHKIFIGFLLRVYLEAAEAKTLTCYELESRNVCLIIFKDYKPEEFEDFMQKLAGIKQHLALVVCQNLVIPKECVVKLFNRYNLETDVSRLIAKTVQFIK